MSYIISHETLSFFFLIEISLWLLFPYPSPSFFLALWIKQKEMKRCHFAFWRFFRNQTSLEGRNTTIESKGQGDCGEAKAFVWPSCVFLCWGLEPLIVQSKNSLVLSNPVAAFITGRDRKSMLGFRKAEFLAAFQTFGESSSWISKSEDTEWPRVGKDAPPRYLLPSSWASCFLARSQLWLEHWIWTVNSGSFPSE